MKNLAQAILKVMEDVKGIDKTMTIGTGNSSYKGVPDQEVKKIIGESMKKHGLVILPTSVEPTLQIDRWTETGQYGEKQKQSIFTEVKTKYLLLHESGESMELAGYGHGVDTQDKGAGKATTYALKYTLLYMFLVPTGKIDDADVTHSDSHETPPPANKEAKKNWLNKGTEAYEKVIAALKSGSYNVADVKKKYSLSKAMEQELTDIMNGLSENTEYPASYPNA
jgi:hypothetical protein